MVMPPWSLRVGYTMAAAPVIILVQAFLSRAVSCAAAALALPGRGRRGRLKLELIAHVGPV